MLLKALKFVSLGLIGAGVILIGFGVANHYDKKPRTNMPDMIFAPIGTGTVPPLIRLHDAKTHEFFCSGMVVSANYALTAGHCLQGRSRYRQSIEIFDATGKKTPIKAVAAFYESRSDTGMILGDFSKFRPQVASPDPETIIQIMLDPFRQIVTCGFPYGGEPICFQMMQRRAYDFGFIGIGFLYPGMSGGPVIDTETGIVVGVNTGVYEGAIYVSPLTEILTHAKVKVINP